MLKNKVEPYSNTSNDALKESFKFNKNFVKLEYKIDIVTQVNKFLNKRLVDMETQCWTNAKYSSRECLEVVGIPGDASNSDLESEVFSKVGLRSPLMIIRHVIVSWTIIIEFFFYFLKKKLWWGYVTLWGLQKVKMEDAVLRDGNPTFKNQAFCPYCRMLWSKNKRFYFQ